MSAARRCYQSNQANVIITDLNEKAKADLEYLRTFFTSQGIAEAQLQSTYGECGNDREQTFTKLTEVTLKRTGQAQPRASKKKRTRADMENVQMSGSASSSQMGTPVKAQLEPVKVDTKRQLSE